MTSDDQPNQSENKWTDERMARMLRARIETFWNADYMERIVLPLLDIPPQAHALDVGSGYGVLGLLLAQRRPDLQVTGVDREPTAVADAAQTAARMGLLNVRFQVGDATALPFGDRAFDAVLCQTLLSHVPDASVVVREMARVLRPGGRFLAVEYYQTSSLLCHLDAATSLSDPARLTEWWRLLQLYTEGKKARGHGDERIGVQAPGLIAAAGLRVESVRLNDRVSYAIPPYATPSEQADVDWWRGLVTGVAPLQAEITDSIRAAGGSDDDVQRCLDIITFAADRDAILQAIDERRLQAVRALPMFLTFARKPEA